MKEINSELEKSNLEKDNDEFFYGSNYINNLNNIFLNNKPKIKILNKKDILDINKELEINLNIICKIYPETITSLFDEYKYFQILSKVVYPSIQIFYGILNNPKNNTNFEIVLEYIPSNLEEVQTFISKCSNGNEINYLIITKISEVLSYIYECGFPFLVLCPNNIKFNNKLFKQYFKVNEDTNFLYVINKDYFSNPI